MGRRSKLLFGLILCLAGAIWVWAASADNKPEEVKGDLKSRVFAAITAQAEKIKTLSSDFSQERHMEMLKNPMVSTGRFFYEKPDRLFWEVKGSKSMGFSVVGRTAKRWSGNPGNGQTLSAEEDPLIRAVSEQIFFWSRADFQTLEKKYRIQMKEEAPTVLRLVPLSAQEKAFVSHVDIVFAPDWSHVRVVEIHEKGGDFTRILFSNTRLNPSLPEGLWKQ